MTFTQDQISEFLSDYAREKGIDDLFKKALDAYMHSERELYRLSHPSDYSNGYRPRRFVSHRKELVLSVPRTRSGAFHPVLLGVLRAEEEERHRLIYSLFKRGLTTEQISDVIEEIFGKAYSKQQISYLMKSSKRDVDLWLNRRLERRYFAVYFDALFVSTRRDSSVEKEAYYTFIGLRMDGKREVLGVVNHPTEGALLWEEELRGLRERGVEQVDLFISDALSGIEDAVQRVFPGSKHQFCCVHLKRNILSHFPHKKKQAVAQELQEVVVMEKEGINKVDGFNKLCNFVDKYVSSYPSLKRYKQPRNVAYFTYLDFPLGMQRMIYSTNWAERLNRDYRRVLKMRGAMPSYQSVISLIGAVAMEKEETTYAHTVYKMKDMIIEYEANHPPMGHCSATLHNAP